MMYKYTPVQDQAEGADLVATKTINRYGVAVYVDSDPDWAGADFIIDPADEKGLAIFLDFAAKMAEHYKSLL